MENLGCQESVAPNLLLSKNLRNATGISGTSHFDSASLPLRLSEGPPTRSGEDSPWAAVGPPPGHNPLPSFCGRHFGVGGSIPARRKARLLRPEGGVHGSSTAPGPSARRRVPAVSPAVRWRSRFPASPSISGDPGGRVLGLGGNRNGLSPSRPNRPHEGVGGAREKGAGSRTSARRRLLPRGDDACDTGSLPRRALEHERRPRNHPRPRPRGWSVCGPAASTRRRGHSGRPDPAPSRASPAPEARGARVFSVENVS